MTDEPVYENVEEADIVDERTGQIIPHGANALVTQPPVNTLQTQVNINTIGTLELTPEAEASLSEQLDDKDVLIRPDGMVYLSWTWYAERLNKAFGKLKWGLVPQGGPQSKDLGNNNVLVVWGFWLVVKGVPVGFSMGETSYRTNNNTMSFGDAVEGAKSIALARNCKMLGMSLELWNQTWVNSWKKKYAETYEHNGKTLWRKKVAKMPTAQPEAVKAAVEEGGVVVAQTEEPVQETGEIKKIALSELRTVAMVNKMAGAFGVEKSVVVKALGKLEAGHSYSFDEVKNKIEEK